MIRGSIPFLFYILVSAFLYFRIVIGLNLKRRGRIYIGSILLIILSLFILHSILSSKVKLTPLFLLSGFLMGSMLIAGTLFFIEMLLSLYFKKKRKYFVYITLFFTLAVSVYSWINGRSNPVIKTVEIRLDDLPAKLSGFSIVHLSDIHIERGITSGDWLKSMVLKVNGTNPDLIVITGDIVSMVIKDREEYSKILSGLKSNFGEFCVTGNVDFGNNLDTFDEIIKETGIKVLVNENIRLPNGVILAGVDDREGSRSRRKNRGTDVKKAFKGIVKESEPVIFLSHRPGVFDEAIKFGVDLQLSGHTHAGQIPPLDLFSVFYFKYNYGLYRRGNSFLHVSSGTGTWPFIPMRLFSGNFIFKLTMKRKIEK